MLVGNCRAVWQIADHLVAQEVTVVEAEPDAALTEERVRLHGHRQVRQRLVSPDVEGPQGDPPTVHRLGDRVVLALLLLDVGGGAPVEEQELGAHQSGAVRAGRERGSGVGHRSEVGGHDDGRAVAGHGRLLGEGELPGALLGDLRGATSVLLQ